MYCIEMSSMVLASETANNNRPRILTIEGNIGAGKSTFLQRLQTRYADRSDILFLLEPVGLWEQVKDEQGKNMLEKFYENPQKYSFAFQSMAFSSRLKLIREAVEKAEEVDSPIKTIIMERSLDADREIFAQMLRDDGLLEKCEHDIYLMMSEESQRKYSADGILWLTAEPDVCHGRIATRGREGEDQISLDYLEKCGQYHRQWLGADSGFVFQVEDSKSEDGEFWNHVDSYVLQV